MKIFMMILILQVSSGEEDDDDDGGELDQGVVPPGFRYFRARQDIFTRFDFTQRTVDVSNLAAYNMKDKVS